MLSFHQLPGNLTAITRLWNLLLLLKTIVEHNNPLMPHWIQIKQQEQTCYASWISNNPFKGHTGYYSIKEYMPGCTDNYTINKDDFLFYLLLTIHDLNAWICSCVINCVNAGNHAKWEWDLNSNCWFRNCSLHSLHLQMSIITQNWAQITSCCSHHSL